MHPLLPVLMDAAAGRFPPVDGKVTFLPPLHDGWEGVFSLTGHAFLATRLGRRDFSDLGLDGFGSALHPAVLLRMAGDGKVGVLDVTLVAKGVGTESLEPSTSLDRHPRVEYARSRRNDVRVYGDEDGLFTLGTGLAGQLEVSVEASGNGSVRGRQLVQQALATVPDGELLFAAVSPGNARSLRAFLACGFTPIGSEILIRPGSD
jgi:hypothetical protein